jgi:hypothetical protein
MICVVHVNNKLLVFSLVNLSFVTRCFPVRTYEGERIKYLFSLRRLLEAVPDPLKNKKNNKQTNKKTKKT